MLWKHHIWNCKWRRPCKIFFYFHNFLKSIPLGGEFDHLSWSNTIVSIWIILKYKSSWRKLVLCRFERAWKLCYDIIFYELLNLEALSRVADNNKLKALLYCFITIFLSNISCTYVMYKQCIVCRAAGLQYMFVQCIIK